MNKKKFTVIDFLIIIVILAAVIFGIFKMGIFKNSSKEESRAVSFEVLISECEENVADAISEGDVVSISNKEKDTAVVKSIRTETARTMTYNSDEGEYYMKPLEKKKDLYITLEADATQSDTLIEIGTTPVKVGIGMPVRGKGYAVSGYVVGISIDSQEGI